MIPEAMTIDELHSWALSLGLVPFERHAFILGGECVEYEEDGYRLRMVFGNLTATGERFVSVAYSEPGPSYYGKQGPCMSLEKTENELRLWCEKRGWLDKPIQLSIQFT